MSIGYKKWDPERYNKLEECHAINWKPKSKRRRNRPLCGARCRDGHACKAKVVVHPKTCRSVNGRCRLHGGLSTGAKTEDGKKKCSEAASRGMQEYWKKKKAGLIASTPL